MTEDELPGDEDPEGEKPEGEADEEEVQNKDLHLAYWKLALNFLSLLVRAVVEVWEVRGGH
jgi:hypothetical protein